MGGRVDSPAEGSAVIAASMDGVGVLEDGVFVRANAELASSFGYENSDALVGGSWTELYPEAERKRIENEILPQVRDERRWRGEATGVRVDSAAVPQVLSICQSESGRLVWVVRVRSGSVEHDPVPGPMTRSGSDAVRNGGEKIEPKDDWYDGNRPAEPLEMGSQGIRFESLVETAPVPIMVFVPDRGFVYSNRKAVELLGAEDRSELHSHGPERFVHPESREQVRKRIRRVIEDRRATEPTEYRLLGLDDRERFAEIAAAPVTHEGEPAAYIVINDVTPYKRSQARLHRERRFIESVIDAIDDVLYVLDGNGRPHLWNETLLETTGYTDDEIEEMDPRELIPEDHHEHIPGLKEGIDVTEDQRVEIDLLTGDGERIPHEFQGSTFEDPETGEVFHCGVARDISERLEHERELEQYETIVETVGDGVYALDEDLRFTFVNDALCELLELPREELLGTSVTGLMMDQGYDEAVEAHAAVRKRVVEGETDIGTVQTPKPGSDGDHVLEARYRLHPEPDGKYRGSVGVIRDVTERQEREEKVRRQRSLIRGILNTIPDAIFAYDEAGEHVLEEALLDEFAGYSNEELAEMELVDFFSEEDRATARDHLQRVLEEDETVTFEAEIATEAGRLIPHEFRMAPLELEEGPRGIAAAARDITDRRRRERKLESQRDELATLDRINELLLETARELIQTSSRGAVERAVCEQLTASDLYQFAWVGERELDGDRIVPRTSAGEDHSYLDAVTTTADESDPGKGPGGRAMRTGEIQVVNVDDPSFERWHDPANERGFESVAAVPLRHGETVYGVLVVYATREDAFSQREQAGFDVLGRTVGFVIHAARSRELLFADTVVELELEVNDATRFADTAAEFDCELSLDGYVASGERWVQYLTVTDASPEAVGEAMAADPLVDRARVINKGSDSGRIELVLAESSLLQTVTAVGATVRTAEAGAEGGRIVIEAPLDADIRGILDRFQSEFPGSRFVARREHDREIRTVGRPEGLLDGLTDRQREVLEAAYRAGYYTWPRESTAEEVAGSLDLASATLHGHLRKAEETILATLFDAG